MAENNRPSDPPNPADSNQPTDKKAPSRDDDAIDLSGTGSILEGSSGVIPLSELSKPGSSNAVFSWADIIGIPPAPGGGEEGIKFDAISDKDLLQRIVEEEKAAGRVPPALPVADGGATESDLSIKGIPPEFVAKTPVETSGTIFPDHPSSTESAVELDDPILKHGPTASGSVVRFDIPQPPSDAGGMMPAVMPKTVHDDSMPPLPPPGTDYDMPPLAATDSGVTDSGDDLVKTPALFVTPKKTDQDNIFFNIAADRKGGEQGGSDIQLDEPIKRSPDSAAEHSSILDILLGDKEINDAMSKSGGGAKFEFPSGSSFGDALTFDSTELQQGKGWAGTSLPTFLVPPSQPDITMPDIGSEGPAFIKPPTKPSPPSLPSGPLTPPPAAPVKPGAAWLTPVSSEFDLPPIPSNPPLPAGTPVPPVPTFGRSPEFDDSSASGESFNPEEAVDLISERPVGSGISESGSLQISEEEIEASDRRARMMESSAIDLSAHPSIAGLDLDVPEDLPSFRPTPSMEDVPFPTMRGGMDRFPNEDEEEGSVELEIPAISPDDSRITPREDVLRGFSDPDTKLPPARPATPARTAPPGRYTPVPSGRGDAEEAPKPIKRPKVEVSTGQIDIVDSNPRAAARSPKKGGWLAPGLAGLLLGAGGVGGAYFADLLPPMGEMKSPPFRVGDGPKGLPVASNADQAATLLAAGKAPEAVKVFEELVKEAPKSPKALSDLGVARWQAHLQKVSRGETQPGSKTEETSQALKDLQQAYDEWTAASKPAGQEPAAVEAAVYRGQILEAQDQPKLAFSIYDSASKDVSAETKGVFEAHKSRLKVLRRVPPQAPEKETMRLDAKELLAVTILLQADPVLKGSGELKEAGQGFWLALDLASEGKYAEAKNLLQLAIAKHKTNRAANPNKRLNPTTDPNEQIFEIACLQLMEYWDLQAKGPGKTPPSASDPKEFAALKLQYEALQKKKEEADLALTRATDSYEKLATESKTFEKTKKDLEDGLKAAKKDLDAKTGEIAKLNEVVKDREKKLTEYGDAAKTVDAAVEAKKKAEADLAVSKKEVDAKAAEIAKLNVTIKDLDKKLAAVGEPNKALDEAIDAKKKAELALKTSQEETKKVADALASVRGENKSLLEFVQGKVNIAEKELDPAVKQLVKAYEDAKTGKSNARDQLNVLLQLMQATDNEAQARRAGEDADKILTESKDEEYVAKAMAVKALAQRNLQNFVESRKLLEEVSKLPGFKANEFWGKSVTDALDQFKSPEKFAGFSSLTPSGADLYKEQAKVEKAMKAFPKELFPKEYAVLVARRGAIKLDLNEAVGAEADATAAIAGGAEAEGKLILARIAERKGDFAAAVTLFSQAQDAAKDKPSVANDAMLGAIRSRLLQINATTNPKFPPRNKQTRVTPESAVILSVLLLQGETPSNPELQRALDMLDETIKSAPADKREELIAERYFLQALAMASDPIKAREALGLYVEGLNRRNLVPPDHAQTLRVILEQIKKGPTTSAPPKVAVSPPPKEGRPPITIRPLAKSLELAERTFNEGYRLYFLGDYFGAEQSFLKAIANADDARYYYYLALAQSAQNRDAKTVFATANELERRGVPEVKLINDSLERVQGEARKTLETKRP